VSSTAGTEQDGKTSREKHGNTSHETPAMRDECTYRNPDGCRRSGSPPFDGVRGDDPAWQRPRTLERNQIEELERACAARVGAEYHQARRYRPVTLKGGVP
jgi:hypothetical protein